jgi:creatinine amidohydrolase
MLEILDGEAVDMSKASCHFPARIEDPGELRPECAPAIFSWVTADISPDGVMGDATAGSAAKGKRWMELETEALVTLLSDICAQLANATTA